MHPETTITVKVRHPSGQYFTASRHFTADQLVGPAIDLKRVKAELTDRAMAKLREEFPGYLQPTPQ